MIIKKNIILLQKQSIMLKSNILNVSTQTNDIDQCFKWHSQAVNPLKLKNIYTQIFYIDKYN